ncbi:hypothetical protein FRC07_004232 [Ceratobasidium sp. 392]|nr:hypothetical protein FRC07_004232 [Ceratobasidium sp. 392]
MQNNVVGPRFDDRSLQNVNRVAAQITDLFNQFTTAYTDTQTTTFERHYPYEEGVTDQLLLELSRANLGFRMPALPTFKATEKTGKKVIISKRTPLTSRAVAEGHDFKLVFRDQRDTKHIRLLRAKNMTDKPVDYLAGYDAALNETENTMLLSNPDPRIPDCEKEVRRYTTDALGWEP